MAVAVGGKPIYAPELLIRNRASQPKLNNLDLIHLVYARSPSPRQIGLPPGKTPINKSLRLTDHEVKDTNLNTNRDSPTTRVSPFMSGFSALRE